jgi:hypothetical protein
MNYELYYFVVLSVKVKSNECEIREIKDEVCDAVLCQKSAKMSDRLSCVKMT